VALPRRHCVTEGSCYLRVESISMFPSERLERRRISPCNTGELLLHACVSDLKAGPLASETAGENLSCIHDFDLTGWGNGISVASRLRLMSTAPKTTRINVRSSWTMPRRFSYVTCTRTTSATYFTVTGAVRKHSHLVGKRS
jgi:hypothetical protein